MDPPAVPELGRKRTLDQVSGSSNGEDSKVNTRNLLNYDCVLHELGYYDDGQPQKVILREYMEHKFRDIVQSASNKQSNKSASSANGTEAGESALSMDILQVLPNAIIPWVLCFALMGYCIFAVLC